MSNAGIKRHTSLWFAGHPYLPASEAAGLMGRLLIRRRPPAHARGWARSCTARNRATVTWV
jgi:hypothetical protein